MKSGYTLADWFLGTAGLTVAARLTENPDITVGVIEAGKYRIGDPFVDIPV